ncbi:MAG: polyprenyl synthetase family protein [Pseudomonadota bacterium]
MTRDALFATRLDEAATATEVFLTTALSGHGDAPERLMAATRYSALDGGKRLRPFLVLESARLFGQVGAAPLQVAAALECIHCYSLVHDDLPAMDNDALRRGKPTAWKAYDEWTAILAGDALLTFAFELLSDPALDLEPQTKLALVRRLAQASGTQGMVGGQAIDLAADKLGVPAEPDVAHVRKLQAMKTGALILFGVEAGAIIGHASADQRGHLNDYGRAIGLAFQIADDLLDVEGDAAEVGKAVGKDADLGKATLVKLLGVEQARQTLNDAHAEALKHLEPFGDAADVLRATADFIVARRY